MVKWLLKTKLPFDPNAIGCAAALGAMDDPDHVEKTIRTNSDGLRMLSKALTDHGYQTTRSVANFVMVNMQSEEEAGAFHHSLLQEGFISRPLKGFGLPHCVRISTGTADQNKRLVQTLETLAEKFVTT